jgi:hypothetical protein
MPNYTAIGGEITWYSPSLDTSPFNRDVSPSGSGFDFTFQEGASIITDPSPEVGESATNVISFDGINDYLSFSASGLPQKVLGFSTWFYTDNDTDVMNLFGILHSSTAQGLYNLSLNADSTESFAAGNVTFYFRHPNSNNLRGGIDSDLGFQGAGCWQHIALNMDKAAGTVEIFVNGVSQTIVYQSQATGASTITWPLEVGIGGLTNTFGAPFNPFDGYMDDIRFFNDNLSQSEVTSLYGMRIPNCPVPNVCEGSRSNIWNIAGGQESCNTPTGPRGVNNDGQNIRAGNSIGPNRSVTVASGISNVASPLPDGSFNRGRQIIIGVTDNFADVPNSKILGGASNSANGPSIKQSDTMQEKFIKTAIREGNWNQYSGVFETIDVAYSGGWDNTTNSDQAAGLIASTTDNAANPSGEVPGELSYKTSAPNPVQDEYKPKRNF